MGLLAARNAGIEVPDESIDKAIAYFTTMTGPTGIVAYAGASMALVIQRPVPRSPRSSMPSANAKISSSIKLLLD